METKSKSYTNFTTRKRYEIRINTLLLFHSGENKVSNRKNYNDLVD